MSSWNGLDFFIFLILVMNTILGMSRGASKEILSLMCLSAALIFCIVFTVPFAIFLNSSPLVTDVINSPIVQNFMVAIGAGPMTPNLLFHILYSISLLVCFVGVFSLCEAGLNMSGFVESVSFPYAAFNRKVGGTLGFTLGYIISLIFLSILVLHIYRASNIGGNFLGGSFFVNIFRSQIIQLDEFISSQKPENYQKLYENKPYDEKDIYKALNKHELPLPSPPVPSTPKSTENPSEGL